MRWISIAAGLTYRHLMACSYFRSWHWRCCFGQQRLFFFFLSSWHRSSVNLWIMSSLSRILRTGQKFFAGWTSRGSDCRRSELLLVSLHPLASLVTLIDTVKVSGGVTLDQPDHEHQQKRKGHWPRHAGGFLETVRLLVMVVGRGHLSLSPSLHGSISRAPTGTPITHPGARSATIHGGNIETWWYSDIVWHSHPWGEYSDRNLVIDVFSWQWGTIGPKTLPSRIIWPKTLPCQKNQKLLKNIHNTNLDTECPGHSSWSWNPSQGVFNAQHQWQKIIKLIGAPNQETNTHSCNRIPLQKAKSLLCLPPQ